MGGWEELLALLAAPPLIMDFTNIPKSVWFSLDRLPLTLTPRPAEPESFSGISKVMNSCLRSEVSTMSSSSSCCGEGEDRESCLFQFLLNGFENTRSECLFRLCHADVLISFIKQKTTTKKQQLGLMTGAEMCPTTMSLLNCVSSYHHIIISDKKG